MSKQHKNVFIVPAVLIVVVIVIAVGLFVFTGSDVASTVSVKGVTLKIEQKDVDQLYNYAKQSGFNGTKEDILTQAERDYALLALAKSKGISVTLENATEQVKTQVSQLKTRLGEQAFNDELKKQNLSEAEFVAKSAAQLQNVMIINSLLENELYSKLSMTEEELVAYYRQNQVAVTIPETVSASHILVCFEGATQCSKKRTKSDAYDLAMSLAKRALSEPFADLASKNSDDPSAVQNFGNLGAFTRGQMVPQFEAAAFAMNIGDVSKPIETAFGYHVILVYNKSQGRVLSYEEVKDQLAKNYMQERIAQLQPAYIKGIVDSAVIVRRE